MADQIYQTHKLDFVKCSAEETAERANAFRNFMAQRRTVRDFSSKPVDQTVIEDCIMTASGAPSGANQQPWHFVAISDPAAKARIREAAEEEERAFYGGRASVEWIDALAHLGTDENKPFLEEAPWLVAVFGQRWGEQDSGARTKHYYVPESVGIACGFFIAALHNAGLVSLTHTPSPMKFLNEICGRPDNEKPYILMVVGYPKEEAQVPVISKKPADEVITWMSDES